MSEHQRGGHRAVRAFQHVSGGAAMVALVITAALLPGNAEQGADLGAGGPPIVPAGQEVEPEVISVQVPGAGPAARRTVPEAASGAHAELPTVAALEQTDTESYSMVGATWRGTGTPEGLHVEVRTRDNRGWSAWSELHIEPEEGPTEGQDHARGGTAPLWVGSSDGVQVRVSSADGTKPRDLQVELVDPGKSTAYQLMGTTDLLGIPRIISRRQWGADESLGDKCWDPYSSTVEAVFVHHTAGTNSYARSSSDDIVRGIHAYHTRSRGWCDIGYNFLVDQYGQIFEGRDGGVRWPVRGAHAGEVNTGSTGISLMGQFESRRPTAAMKRALVRLIAWQLETRYRDPHGKTWLAGRRYDVISAHRDAMSTACPGRYVYNWLPTLRNRVENWIGDWRSANYRKWQRQGGESGWMGSPLIGERPAYGARLTEFTNADVYYTSQLGTHAVRGKILRKYTRMGGPGSLLGLPRSDERSAGPPRTWRSIFQRGRIYHSRGTGTREVHGAILKRYLRHGGAGGALGLPTSDELTIPGGRRSNFRGGYIVWDAAKKRVRVTYYR